MTNRKYNDPYATALKKVKSHESANDGACHWMLQRITAFAMLPLIIWTVASIIRLGGASYAEFIIWLSDPLNAVLAILFMIISLFHGVMGNEEIIEDYVTHEKLKRIKLIGQKIFFSFLGLLSIVCICKIAFFA